MKNKKLIIAFSLCIIVVVGLIATIVVLASGTQGVGTSVSVLYVATDIEGSVSAKYSRINKNTSAIISTADMVTSSGDKTVKFLAITPTTTSLLNPTDSSIALMAEEDLVITYTFTAVEKYYATLEYKDNSNSPTNIEFTYSLNDEVFLDEMTMPIEISADKSTSYSIKLHIANTAKNASLGGSFNWVLTKTSPNEPIEDTKLSINFTNNGGSVVNNRNVSIQKSSDGTKFKIIGPTPVVDASSTSSYLNGDFSERSIASTGKVSDINDLVNKNGAEFYYFCTNSAVVGSQTYVDPGQVYNVSTSDSTLENWYEFPTEKQTLYSCFMTPNYKTEEVYSGSDSQIIVSNKVNKLITKAFYNITSLRNIVVPQSVTNIESNAFYGCTKLNSITLPANLTVIKEYTFYECSSLKMPDLPDSLTTIEKYAFYGCDGLGNVVISKNVTSLGLCSFADCYYLRKMSVDNDNKVYYSESNCIVERETKTLVMGCGGSKIPSGITKIGDYAFYFPSTVFDIKEITIPDTVTHIGCNAFYGQSGFKSVTIPASVTYIGWYAFRRCQYLETATFEDTTSTWSVTEPVLWGVNFPNFEVTNPENNASMLTISNKYTFKKNTTSA